MATYGFRLRFSYLRQIEGVTKKAKGTAQKRNIIMNRNPASDIKASEYLPAQEFIHTYKLSQWRSIAYLQALDILPTKGIMATDSSIGQFLGNKPKSSIPNLIKPLIKAGLIKKVTDTDLGASYALTRLGVKAVAEAKEITASYYQSIESGEPVQEQPNYQNSFERLNREIKSQRQTIEALTQTIEYQKQIISSLKFELDAAKFTNDGTPNQKYPWSES